MGAPLELRFADDIGPGLRQQITSIVSGWNLPELCGVYRVSRMSGGGSNVNVKFDNGSRPLALRVCSPDPGRWGVDRAASVQAQKDAAKGDLAPAVLAWQPPDGHFLCPFLEGGVLTPERLRREDLLASVVDTLRSLHRLKTDARDFSPFEDAAHFVRLGDQESAKRPLEFAGMYDRVREIASLFTQISAPRAFCHSDLVPQNFIVGDKLRLVDWDYAGNGWIAFELASFACQCGLSDVETERFLGLYDPAFDDGQRSRVALMRSVAGVREAAWATMAEPILSGSTSPLEGWTYQGYASSNLKQAVDVWAGRDFRDLLASAANVRPGALF